MPKKYKLLDTGKKSKVITLRIKESVYSALEKEAQATGGTVSATARKLLVESLGSGKIEYKPGDAIKSEGYGPSSSMIVVFGGEMPTSDSEVSKRVEEILRGAKFEGAPHEK